MEQATVAVRSEADIPLSLSCTFLQLSGAASLSWLMALIVPLMKIGVKTPAKIQSFKLLGSGVSYSHLQLTLTPDGHHRY